eukprot:59895_1
MSFMGRSIRTCVSFSNRTLFRSPMTPALSAFRLELLSTATPTMADQCSRSFCDMPSNAPSQDINGSNTPLGGSQSGAVQDEEEDEEEPIKKRKRSSADPPDLDDVSENASSESVESDSNSSNALPLFRPDIFKSYSGPQPKNSKATACWDDNPFVATIDPTLPPVWDREPAPSTPLYPSPKPSGPKWICSFQPADIVKFMESLGGLVKDISIYDVFDHTEKKDYLIFATAASARHVYAVASQIKQEANRRNVSSDSYFTEEKLEVGVLKRGDEWAVIDLGDVEVHVYTMSNRLEYGLDERLAKYWMRTYKRSSEAKREGEEGDVMLFDQK